MGETWKEMPGFGGLYEVSSLGNVRSYRKSRWGVRETPAILKGQMSKHYRTVALTNADGKAKTYYVHRLVAELFVPNVSDLPEVNHKDGNKLNNRADNLEWCSHKENIEHADRNGLASFNRKRVVCVETGAAYNSVTEAAKNAGTGRTAIDNCLNGRRRTAGGFHWKYEEETK